MFNDENLTGESTDYALAAINTAVAMEATAIKLSQLISLGARYEEAGDYTMALIIMTDADALTGQWLAGMQQVNDLLELAQL